MKTALVTGASSGIGFEMAKKLDAMGYNVIICARRTDRLEKLKSQLKNKSLIITADLSKKEDCYRLYEQTKNKKISVLINNAGFGTIGNFIENDLERELKMIDVNCTAVHILTKLFASDFVKKGKGYILNVGSSAGLMPGGPLMAAYYASKAYVVSLSNSVDQEVRNKTKKVSVSVLCPGPVDTEFNDVAGCHFGVGSISAKYCAECGLKGMFNRQSVIIPGFKMKASTFISKLAPRKIVLKIAGKLQSKKL